jgi:hypothetical protein
MKNVVKWIVGFSFTIAGLLRLLEGSTLSILFIIVGLFVIPPLLAYVEAEAKFQLPRAWKYAGVVFTFVLIVATGQENRPESISSVDTPEKESIPPANESIGDVAEYVPQSPKTKEYTIVSNTETFRKRFNASMSGTRNGSLAIKSLSIQDGEVNNAFQYLLTDHIAIVGQLNKSDNSIRSIIVTLQGDGTLQSGLDIMTTIMGVIDSTNPGLIPEERGQILRELGLFDEGLDIDKIQARATKNGITYSVQGSELIGLMFAVGSEEEKN